MAGRVLVLGGKGRFGRAAVSAFRDAGWSVRSLVRQAPAANSLGVEMIEGDALDSKAIVSAAKDAEVIVNAVNPPYGKWGEVIPRLTRSVLAAVAETKACVLVPGNVYVFGGGMPELLKDTTLHKPTTPQGKIRTHMEAAYREAAERGAGQVILLRGGDFVEGVKSGNWFDSQIMAGLAKGQMMYPGLANLPHAWAYLPDMARAAVMLAERRAQLPAYADIGFAGYDWSGRELFEATQNIVGRKLKLTAAPWGPIKLLANFNPDLRAVVNMSYLWRTPHRVDGTKLASLLPDYRDTPADEALRTSIEALLKSPARS